jgi:hypothetical protein
VEVLVKKIVPLLVLLASCGGGGSDGPSERFIGLWKAQLVLTSNPCNVDLEGSGVQSSLTPTYQVNQAGRNIAVENLATKATLTGATSENGESFLATAAHTISCIHGNIQTDITFENITGDDVDVTIAIRADCPLDHPPSCEIRYEGTAHRS